METVVEKYISNHPMYKGCVLEKIDIEPCGIGWRLSAEDGSCFLFNSEDVQDLIVCYHFVLYNQNT